MTYIYVVFQYLVGKYNAMFQGFNQQDSQEFLLFLMDGLHEDLNKVSRNLNPFMLVRSVIDTSQIIVSP